MSRFAPSAPVLQHSDDSSLTPITAPADAPSPLRHASSLSWWRVAPPATTSESRAPAEWTQPFPLLLLRVDADPARVEDALRWLFAPQAATPSLASLLHTSLKALYEALYLPAWSRMPPIGFDTESSQDGRLCTLQLYYQGRALVLHAPTGTFPAHCGSALRAVLEGTSRHRPVDTVFTGAELAADAVDVHEHMACVRMHGCIDVTAVHPAAASPGVLPRGLRFMLNSVHGCDWHKPSAVACSNWAAATLDYEQIKYAALDAWASAVVGADAINIAATEGCDPLCAAFTLRDAPTSMLHRAWTLLREAKALIKAQDKSYRVPVVDVQTNVASTKHLTLVMEEFDRRVRRQYPMLIEYTDQADDDVFTGTCTSVEGRRAFIELDTNDAMEVAARYRANKKHVVFSTDNSEDPAAVLLRASGTIKALTRARRLSTSPSFTALADRASALVRIDIIHSQRALQAYNFLFGKGALEPSAPHASSMSPLQREAIDTHGAHLDDSQRTALKSALRRPLTAIRGPPGTGKTRVIAAIAEAFADCGERLVLVAPANAATRRVLETNLRAGYESMALAVSKDYFYDWHERMYDESLLRYTVTPAAEDPAVERMRLNSVWLADDTRTPVSTTVTVSSLVLHVDAAAPASASASGQARTPRRMMRWPQLLQSLVKSDTVTTLVVDEASQLWDGLLLHLLVLFPSLRTVIMVGDEHQLPPYGADDADCRSAFECVLERPGAVVHTLSNTYRLPATIANLLSARFYGGELVAFRSRARDELAWDRLAACARSSYTSPLSAAVWTKAAANRMSLLWLHVPSSDASISRARDSQSLANEDEVRIAAQLAADLILFDWSRVPDARTLSDMPRLRRVVVVTPYQNQRQRIETQLCALLTRSTRWTLHHVTEHIRSQRVVTCVDGFQGQEADIVILSLVRARGLGFLREDRRCNVMLSRAAHAMVVVGNVYTFLAASTAAPAGRAATGPPPPSVLKLFAEQCAATGVVYDVHPGGIRPLLIASRASTAPPPPPRTVPPSGAPVRVAVAAAAVPSSRATLQPAAAPRPAARPAAIVLNSTTRPAATGDAFASFIYDTLRSGPVALAPLGQKWQAHCIRHGLPHTSGSGKLTKHLMRLYGVAVEPGSTYAGSARALLVSASLPAAAAPRTPAAKPSESVVVRVEPRRVGDTSAAFTAFVYEVLARGPMHLAPLGQAWRVFCNLNGLPHACGNLAKRLLQLPGVDVERGSMFAGDARAVLRPSTRRPVAIISNTDDTREFASFVVGMLFRGPMGLAPLGLAWQSHCAATGCAFGDGKLATRLRRIPGVHVEYGAEFAGAARAVYAGRRPSTRMMLLE